MPPQSLRSAPASWHRHCIRDDLVAGADQLPLLFQVISPRLRRFGIESLLAHTRLSKFSYRWDRRTRSTPQTGSAFLVDRVDRIGDFDPGGIAFTVFSRRPHSTIRVSGRIGHSGDHQSGQKPFTIAGCFG